MSLKQRLIDFLLENAHHLSEIYEAFPGEKSLPSEVGLVEH